MVVPLLSTQWWKTTVDQSYNVLFFLMVDRLQWVFGSEAYHEL